LGRDREEDLGFASRKFWRGSSGVNDEIVVITPESSPAAGGVGDYTLRLLENWPKSWSVKILSSQDDLPASAGKVLVQYSAYGFDRFGYPRKLIRALIDWKRKTRGRLVIMFHEIWTFWPVTNKNFFIQFLHRRAIKRLLNYADEVFTSTQSQAEYLRALSPRRSVHVLPVSSNIRRGNDIDLVRAAGCAAVFGLQKTRIRALKRTQNSLASLAAGGQVTKIISVGAGVDSGDDAEERALLATLNLKDGFEQRGPRSEQEISKLLLTSSFGIFGQDQLSLGKSGTFMAYAAHELNVLADFADVSMPEPICWLVAPRELPAGVSQSELKIRAQRLATWQRGNSSPELIAKAFAEALHMDFTRAMPAGGEHL
jgi:hypothetical protein